MKKDTATYRKSASPVSQTSVSAVWESAEQGEHGHFSNGQALYWTSPRSRAKQQGHHPRKDTFLIQKWMNKCENELKQKWKSLNGSVLSPQGVLRKNEELFGIFRSKKKCGVLRMQRERLQTQPRHRIFTMGSPILDRAESLKFPVMEWHSKSHKTSCSLGSQTQWNGSTPNWGRNFTIWRIPKDPVSSSAIKEVKSSQTNGDTLEPPVEPQKNLSCLLFFPSHSKTLYTSQPLKPILSTLNVSRPF